MDSSDRPTKRQKLSTEQRRSIEALTSAKLYEYRASAPTRELNHEEALKAVSSFISKVADINDANEFDRSTINKATFSIITAKEMQNDIEENDESNQEIQRYFSYEIDGTSVGLTMIRHSIADIKNIKIDYLISHPGIRGAASALIEEILKINNEITEISLHSTHGALSVYRRLGFIPKEMHKFKDAELLDYDKLFFNMPQSAVFNLDQSTKKIYRSYKNMILRPTESADWAKIGDAWRFLPDGETYLADNPSR